MNMKIELKNVTKKYKELKALESISIRFNEGEFTSILGPSGCGKSTLLFVISGLINIDNGKVYFNDRDISLVETEKRNIGMVFQNYSLYPHMTVKENLLFPLKMKKTSKEYNMERVNYVLNLLKIENLIDRRPNELSGGQQQRVAIARALVKEPDILLMDEPFSNLDAKLRLEMREEIRRVQYETGITTLFVTHDQEEALTLSHNIVLMDKGEVIQISTPKELYERPLNIFAAEFIGSPPINIIDGKIENNKFIAENFSINLKKDFKNIEKIKLAIRPENIEISKVGLEFKIVDLKLLGKDIWIKIERENLILNLIASKNKNFEKDSVIRVIFKEILLYKDNQLLKGEKYEVEEI